MQEQIGIKTEYITLGQFLKLANILESGGMIKVYLQEQGVKVNGEVEHRRGRKLYPQDVIELENGDTFIVVGE
ncbi:S4 domain-containing protein YaaA [Virgibacillus soli]|uniref:S4 domain-containing protein YaaA n=1 Tax=Paracerasibacillus soli TaxID=480284 RepID=A0ABU5CU88_9BACI|nr:S4 domain-containing protein YaaA [Virgibacillus soli]MDY0409938.1 S4 domain-containing protein YaaA [Virgibacillus soli]